MVLISRFQTAMKRYLHSGIGTWVSLALLCLLAFSSCIRPRSGNQLKHWKRNRKGKSEVLRKAPPNMVYIPAGKFVMGELESSAIAEHNALPRTEEVEAFYMDITEVTNRAYLAYLNWLQKKGDDVLDYQYALPDTHSWHRPMSYNEPMVRNYLRHTAYRYYPVVGVTWVQASQYCEWRSARINELDSNSDDSVIIRLPTEHEWEYASLTNYNYNELNQTNDRDFSIRQRFGFGRGKMMHNFQRGRGDAQGLSHRPNDGAFIPSPVYEYEANDFGLFNMYGNVAEWVGDAYVPVTVEDVMEEVNPNEALYNIDSLKKDPNFVTPDMTFSTIMDSLGIENGEDTEVETDITGAILRVYKGASWHDRAYFLNPGTRRFLPQNAATSYIGFRCVSDIPEDLRKESSDEGSEVDTTSADAKGAYRAKQAEKEKEKEGEEKGDEEEDDKKKDKEAIKEEKRKAKEKKKADKAKENERKKKEKEARKNKDKEEDEEEGDE